MNLNELAQYFNVQESNITTNFPRFAMRKLKQGYLITREGRGSNTIYNIQKTEPKEVDKSFFRNNKEINNQKKDIEDLEGEIWTTCCIDSDYEVSNLGRIKYVPLQRINQGTLTKGYRTVSIRNKDYRLHRIILQSFDPRENWQELTVDHINGKRDDNRLENLRWVTLEDNVGLMIIHRAELNKELTRIIQKIGYDETLKLLQSL